MAFKNFKTKKLTHETNNHESIEGAILDKKALPEIRFKYDLFVAHSDLIKSLQILKTNSALNNNHSSLNDIARVKAHVSSLFGYLKYMILEKTNYMEEKEAKRFGNDWQTFHKINKMYRGQESNVDVKTLCEMVDFLLQWMHDLALTNLLKAEYDPLDDFYRGA